MCAEKFPLVSMGGRAEGLACAYPGARTPIGASGNFHCNFLSRLITLLYRAQFGGKLGWSTIAEDVRLVEVG